MTTGHNEVRASRKARIGVAGLGRMGRVHASNLARRCPSAELAVVFDEKPGVSGQVSEELGVPAASSYEEMLADETLDAVVIAAPTGAHAELAVQAAKAGKDVFCEKPLSLRRAVNVEVVEALESAGVKLQVGFNRRFDPSTAAAAQRVLAGELGDVYMLRVSQRDMSPPKPEFLAGSGGIFLDMGIHDFDLARWLVGEVATVSAYGAALSSPAFAEAGDFDTVAVVLEFVGGQVGLLDISRVAGYGYESSFEVMGSRATVRVGDPFSRRYEWRSDGWCGRPLVETFDRRYSEAFSAELEAFARSVLTGTPPAVTGRDALAAFDLAQAAEESCRLGQPVKIATSGKPARAQERP
ncbi:MAG: Gfo/Idh/MocA family oxidoreductase [Acidimicrobiales bacterium]